MQPQAPNGNYDFIFQNKPQPKRSALPTKNPFLILAGVLIVGMVLILAFSLAFGKKSSGTASLNEVLGRAQEISRVTEAQSQQLKDPDTISLSATTQAVMTSEQNQIKDYFTHHKIKYDAKKLTAYKNTQVDSQLQQAAQSNNLDAAYVSYLHGALNDYSTALQHTYSATSSPSAKSMIKDFYQSLQALLASPKFKTQ